MLSHLSIEYRFTHLNISQRSDQHGTNGERTPKLVAEAKPGGSSAKLQNCYIVLLFPIRRASSRENIVSRTGLALPVLLPIFFLIISPPSRCSRKCQNLKGFHALLRLLLSPQVGGGGDASHGQIEIFSLNRPVPRAVKSLLVGSVVRCLEYVPEPSPNEETVGSHKASSGLGAHICAGLEDGR